MVFKRRIVRRTIRRKPKVSKTVKKYVEKKIKNEEEMKLSTYTISIADGTAATNSTGSVVQLANIAQGADVGNREGNVVCVRKIRIDYVTTPFDDNDGNTNRPQSDATKFRILIIADHQNIGALPTIADIFDSVSPQSPININAKNSKRFKIIMDSFHYMPPMYSRAGISAATLAYPNALVYADKTYVHKRRSYKVNFKMQYTGTAGTSYSKNQLFIVYLSDQATARSPYIQGLVSMYYTDD